MSSPTRCSRLWRRLCCCRRRCCATNVSPCQANRRQRCDTARAAKSTAPTTDATLLPNPEAREQAKQDSVLSASPSSAHATVSTNSSCGCGKGNVYTPLWCGIPDSICIESEISSNKKEETGLLSFRSRSILVRFWCRTLPIFDSSCVAVCAWSSEIQAVSSKAQRSSPP